MSPKKALEKIAKALDISLDWPEELSAIDSHGHTRSGAMLLKQAVSPMSKAGADASALREVASDTFDPNAAQEFWEHVPLDADLLAVALGVTPGPTYLRELADHLHRKPTSNEMAIWIDAYRMHLFADAPTGPRVQCVCGRIVSQWAARICPACNRVLCDRCITAYSLHGSRITICPKCAEQVPDTWLDDFDDDDDD